MDYFIYFAKNSLGQLYIGQTVNLDARISRHQRGHGARFTSVNQRDFQIVYYEKHSTLEEATKRERQLKGWTRAKKEALIAGKIDLLKKL
ncbi:MAG: GIY-YIG nuclease family protein [Patescibacteria group bacterium]|mgnify:CR=1 FL=1